MTSPRIPSLRLVAFLAALSFSPLSHAADPAPPAATEGGPKFEITAGDDSASMTAITVKKGEKVSLTFKVDPDRTYHAGLQFRSASVETDPIRPGETQTVTFVADKSFSLIPYWPASNRKKGYEIRVTVE